jgi:hypothetical protein
MLFNAISLRRSTRTLLNFGMECWKCHILFPTGEEGIAHQQVCGSFAMRAKPPHFSVRGIEISSNPTTPYFLYINIQKEGLAPHLGSIYLLNDTREVELWNLWCPITYRATHWKSSAKFPQLVKQFPFPVREATAKKKVTGGNRQELFTPATNAVALCKSLECEDVGSAVSL